MVTTLRQEGPDAIGMPLSRAAARVGETPSGRRRVAGTPEEYLKAGGAPDQEPLAATLTRYDCVTLVEGTLAVARIARRAGAPTWAAFEEEVTRMRYRDGRRGGYANRLHYASEWIQDCARRGLVRDPGRRPRRHRRHAAPPLHVGPPRQLPRPGRRPPAPHHRRPGAGARRRPALGDPHGADPGHRRPAPAGGRAGLCHEHRGLDVTHTALVHRDPGGETRVLHAPLSGGTVEIAARALPDYVSGHPPRDGVLVARALV
ncbi:MAG: DUF1460 domain-containing protein [Gemmatimonadetes bacterium]|nr:DUF1460 domain-containing protein [Gemmatimonadota bacterium]